MDTRTPAPQKRDDGIRGGTTGEQTPTPGHETGIEA